MKITDDILYVGVNDHDIDLFEGQFEVPLGMAYNSYVVKGEKVAVMDTVDARFGDEWLKNVAAATDKVDYLVVHHMEPDHSSNIARFAEAYPNAKIVSSMQAFAIMKNYFGTDFTDRRVVVKEGDTLDLGGHTLAFVGAPMVHWPEVVVSYDTATKTLFSADGFGKFGANDKVDPEGWDCEARRYYFGIVGKFGMQVQATLRSTATPRPSSRSSARSLRRRAAPRSRAPTSRATTCTRRSRMASATGGSSLRRRLTTPESSRRWRSTSAISFGATTRTARSASLRTARGARWRRRA